MIHYGSFRDSSVVLQVHTAKGTSVIPGSAEDNGESSSCLGHHDNYWLTSIPHATPWLLCLTFSTGFVAFVIFKILRYTLMKPTLTGFCSLCMAMSRRKTYLIDYRLGPKSWKHLYEHFFQVSFSLYRHEHFSFSNTGPHKYSERKLTFLLLRIKKQEIKDDRLHACLNERKTQH